MAGLDLLTYALRRTASSLVQSEDFIPAPAGGPPAPAEPAQQAPSIPDIPLPIEQFGLDTTKLVIGVAIVLVLALVLFFVRGGIKNALMSRRSSLDAANFAAWSWFLYLLVVCTLVVFGLLGGFFGLVPYLSATVGVGVIGLIICLVVSANARATRK